MSGSELGYNGTDPVGPVGPYVTVDQVQPVADGPVGPYITLNPVGSDRMPSSYDSDQPVAEHSVSSRSESEYNGTDPVGPVGPYVTFDQVQPVADGPVGPYITLSPVGSDGMNSSCDSDQPVADGPVGPSVTLGPVAQVGRYPSVTLISRWLMARWAHLMNLA